MKKKKENSKSVNIRKLEQKNKNNLINKGINELKDKIISKIKKRSNKKDILNEISKDIAIMKLEPKDLIILDYINEKISKS
jgi:hypothetical protein